MVDEGKPLPVPLLVPVPRAREEDGTAQRWSLGARPPMVWCSASRVARKTSIKRNGGGAAQVCAAMPYACSVT